MPHPVAASLIFATWLCASQSEHTQSSSPGPQTHTDNLGNTGTLLSSPSSVKTHRRTHLLETAIHWINSFNCLSSVSQVSLVCSLTFVIRMSSEVCQLCLEALTPLAEQCAKAQETDSPLFLATRHFLKVRCLGAVIARGGQGGGGGSSLQGAAPSSTRRSCLSVHCSFWRSAFLDTLSSTVILCS